MNNIVLSKSRVKGTYMRIREVLPALAFTWCTATACTDSVLNPPTEDLSSLYWELRANHSAILLSTAPSFNTLQLTVAPFGPDGSPFVTDTEIGAPSPEQTTWTSSDPLTVTVSETGLLTAHDVTDGVTISVAHTIGAKTHIVIVSVRVTDEMDPPVLTTFSVQPTDSFKRAALNFFPYPFPVVAQDADGNSLGTIPVGWRSSNVKAARFEQSSFFGDGLLVLTPLIPRVVISAQTMVYGVAKTDSFTLELGWPLGDFVLRIRATEVMQVGSTTGQSVFTPSVKKAELGPGGQVVFANNTGFGPTNVNGIRARAGSTIDIVFDDPSVALAIPLFPGDASGESGNIVGLPSDTTLVPSDREASRRFVKRGKHEFTIQPFGVRGSVYVQER